MLEAIIGVGCITSVEQCTFDTATIIIGGEEMQLSWGREEWDAVRQQSSAPSILLYQKCAGEMQLSWRLARWEAIPQ